VTSGRNKDFFQILHEPKLKEFRFEGTEVRVSKVGDKVILEPISKPPLDLDKFWDELDALGARDFLPEGLPDDPPLQPDPRALFDE